MLRRDESRGLSPTLFAAFVLLAGACGGTIAAGNENAGVDAASAGTAPVPYQQFERCPTVHNVHLGRRMFRAMRAPAPVGLLLVLRQIGTTVRLAKLRVRLVGEQQ